MNKTNSLTQEKRKEMMLTAIFFLATIVLLYTMIQISVTFNY